VFRVRGPEQESASGIRHLAVAMDDNEGDILTRGEELLLYMLVCSVMTREASDRVSKI
jgi:hypothetical protein